MRGYPLLLAGLIISPVFSFYEGGADETCTERAARVRQIDRAYTSEPFSYGSIQYIEYKNYFALSHISNVECAVLLDDDLSSVTTLYRQNPNTIARSNNAFALVLELLPYLAPALEGDEETKVIIPESLSLFASELIEATTGLRYSRAQLETGMVFPTPVLTFFRESLHDRMLWHQLYNSQSFFARLIDGSYEKATVQFFWASDCDVTGEHTEVTLKLNEQPVVFSAFCAGQPIGPNFMALSPAWSDDEGYINAQFRKDSWVSLDISNGQSVGIPFYGQESVPVIDFWTDGFSHLWSVAENLP